MKSSYELAMERLNQSAQTVKMNAAKKKQLAELDKKYTAKIAERELFLKGELAKTAAKGDYEVYAQLEKQLVIDRNSLKTELEEKKEKVRQSAG